MRLFIVAWLAGVIVLQREPSLPDVAWGPAGIAALLALHFVRSRVARALVVLAAGALCGYGFAAWRAGERLADALPFPWEGTDIEIVGVASGLPQPNESGTRFAFEVERVRTPGAIVPRDIALTWYPDRRGASAPKLAAGDRWRFTVRLKRPRGLANPHAFDFEPWALERGIRATGYVRTASPHERIDAHVDGWPYTLHRWRGEIRDAMLERLAGERLRGVLVALAIGDQDAIAPDDWDVFWRTGVGHLMSISGLHITMLAALAAAAVLFAWVRVPALALRLPARKAAVVVGALAAVAYALMTGYAVPAQRTVLMLSTLAACILADRHGSPSRVLALAAFVAVLVDPWAVLSPGFWLSFGAVASIFYVMCLRAGKRGRVASVLAEQLAVTAGMLPMLLALFQEFSLVSPLANALAIPVVSLLVVPLAIAGAFLPLPFLLDAAHATMLVLMSPLERLADLPLAMLESHEPAAWTVVTAVAGLAWILAPRGVPMRSLGAAWVAPLFAVAPASPAAGEAWIDVLDVGNGLAVVVRTAGHALLYDAGPAWNGDADSGSRIVVPFLRGEGIRTLDGVVITHADDDHSGGAASVAYAREPRWLISTLGPDHVLQGAFAAAGRCEAGLRWEWDRVDFHVLHPGAEIYDAPGRRKENDRSCVLRVATAGHAALLTGDAEARSEVEMLRRYGDALASEVLLIPHHGSKTSSTLAFIDGVAPRIGLLSVGYRNRFHHPSGEVVGRYLARGVRLHRTDEEGALRVVLPVDAQERVSVSGEARHVRYWSEHGAPTADAQ